MGVPHRVPPSRAGCRRVGAWSQHPGVELALVPQVSQRSSLCLLAPGRDLLGLSPANVTTAWIALSASTPENGCLCVLPESHRPPLLPQRETYAPDNMLSRGQKIAVAVDEAQAVDLPLRPGEFSLHHIGVVHGSGPNRSAVDRIGLAVRYISPDVVQSGSERELVLLVRGQDEYGNFELADPPQEDMAYGESRVHHEAMRRKVSNLMPRNQQAEK